MTMMIMVSVINHVVFSLVVVDAHVACVIRQCQCQCQSKFFSVAKIAELLRRFITWRLQCERVFMVNHSSLTKPR